MTQVRRVWAASVVLVFCVLLAGCRVDTKVVIRVAENGGGTVNVTLTLDRQAFERLGGAQAAAQASFDDLHAAGWKISPVRPADDGGASIELAHQFTDQADLAAVLAGVFGPQGVMRDPRIERDRGWLRSEDRASVVVDLGALRAGISGDTPLRDALTQAGLEPAQLEAELTDELRDAAQVTVEVRLPGGASRTFTAGGGDDVAPTTVAVSSSRGHTVRVVFAVLAVLAVIAAVGLLLWARRAARRARASSG